MSTFNKYAYQILIVFLLSLLISGYLLNKKSSESKKNEISNILNQLETRNIQISKIQKNLFNENKNINDLINQKEITFKKISENEKFNDLNGYSFSKYRTNDILFNGNPRAIGTGYVDFYKDDKNLFLATYDGIFAIAQLKDIRNFKKIDSNIFTLIKYEKFYFHNQ